MGLVILYISIIKKKLFKIGQEQLIHSRLKMKSSQETFQGMKTLKVFRRKKNLLIDMCIIFGEMLIFLE